MAKKVKKARKKKTAADYILIFGILIILIPCAALGYFLWQAQQEGSNVILGKRVDNERTVEITEDALNRLSSTISSMADVEDAEVVLKVSTVRIYIDTKDNLGIEEITEIAEGAYAAVNDLLPVDSYFTQKSNARNYDLEIHVYNNREYIDTDRFIYVTLVKNSAMDEYIIDNPSEPRDADLAKELRGETQSDSVIDGDDDAEAAGDSEDTDDGE